MKKSIANNQEPKPLRQWLLDTCANYSQRTAILDVERPGTNYHQLMDQISQLIEQLNALGIARNDVCVVGLPDGGNALITILGVAATAIVFPLNPNSSLEELSRYFAEVNISAVIVEEKTSSNLVTVAKQMGVCLIELSADRGKFLLSSQSNIPNPKYDPPQLDDPLIYIGTAGSTSTPKIVSLTHKSIYISINHAGEWMGLNEDDCSLCVMPFAHLHSIVRSTFPGLLRGGMIVCTPGFNPGRMLNWIERFQQLTMNNGQLTITST